MQAVAPQKNNGCTMAIFFIAGLFVLSFAIGAIAYTGRATGLLPAIIPTPVATSAPTLSASEIRSSASRVAYDNLARYTEKYQGKIVHLYGVVTQVVEGESSATLLVRIAGGDLALVHHSGDRILPYDEIDFYAHVDGRTTYTTVLGARVTVPELTTRLLTVKN